MLKRKKSINWILLGVFVICCSLLKATAYAEASGTEAPLELLLVIDGSGSLQEEESAINRTLQLMYEWLGKEPLIQSMEIEIFTDKAVFMEYDENAKIGMKGSTDISVGLEAADAWIEKRKDMGHRLCVIVVSDFVSYPGKAYTLEEAEEEQRIVNEIIDKWNAYADEDRLNYLFVTWASDTKKLEAQDGASSVKSFLCDISDCKEIYWLLERKETKQEERISQVEMNAGIAERIVEILSGVTKIKSKYYGMDAGHTLRLKEYYEAFIFLGGDNYLVEKDGNAAMEPFCCIEDVKMYRLGRAESDKEYKVISEKEEYECSFFYIPLTNPSVYTGTVDKKVDIPFEIKCEFRNAYQERVIVRPLKVLFYQGKDSSGKLLENKNMTERDGYYGCDITAEEQGDYFYEVKSADGQLLGSEHIKIKEVAKKPTVTPVNTVVPDEIEQGGSDGAWVYIIAGIVVAGGMVLYAYRRNGNERK